MSGPADFERQFTSLKCPDVQQKEEYKQEQAVPVDSRKKKANPKESGQEFSNIQLR